MCHNYVLYWICDNKCRKINMKKHISYRSAELLHALNVRNQSFFTIKDAKNILVSSKDESVRRLLIYMAI